MIINTNIRYTISGKDLDPSIIEKDFSCSFSQINIKGEIYKKGHRKGKRIEISSATITSENESYKQDNDGIFKVAKLALAIENLRKKYKIQDSNFNISFNYAAQCGLSFEKRELECLSQLGFVNIDCYMIYDTYETKQISTSKELLMFYNNGILEKETELDLE